MNLKVISIIFLLCLFVKPVFASQKNCSYSHNQQAFKISWTAFKTSKKLPVKGQFLDFSAKTSDKASSLKKLIDSATVSLNLSKITTGNPARDKTLLDQFFSLIPAKTPVTASARNVKIDGNKGSFNLKLTLNGMTRDIPMKLSVTGNQLQATGNFDLFDFALNKAHASLHKACEKLHTGEDGKSKTWRQVDINLQGQFNKKCW